MNVHRDTRIKSKDPKSINDAKILSMSHTGWFNRYHGILIMVCYNPYITGARISSPTHPLNNLANSFHPNFNSNSANLPLDDSEKGKKNTHTHISNLLSREPGNSRCFFFSKS